MNMITRMSMMILVLLLTKLCGHMSVALILSCSVTYDKLTQDEIADCSNRNLLEVPSDLPASITRLYLTNNKLSRLETKVFSNYTKLQELDLSSNKISIFEDDCFFGLSNLSSLDLSRNTFAFDNETFKHNVFMPLKQLRVLNIDTQAPPRSSGSFPSDIFKTMVHLRHLSMDTWPAEPYRYAFAYLKELQKISIVGLTKCNLQVFKNNTFEVLGDIGIESLYTHCYVIRMEADALAHFPNLKEWTFHTTFGSVLALRNITVLLNPFVGKNMTLIDLTGVQDIRESYVIDSTLGRESLTYLLDVCVKKAVLSRNHLRWLSTSVNNSTFQKCIEYLDGSENQFTANYGSIFVLRDCQRLKVLDISRQRYSGSVENGISDFTKATSPHLILQCPPNIEQVIIRAGYNISHFPGYMNITISNCKHLWKLDISDTGIYFIHGYLTGLSSLKYLDFSGDTIEDSWFRYSDINDLQVFKADRSVLKLSFTRSVISKLSSVKFLSLANSGLDFVPTNSFSDLYKTQTLVLKGNRFQAIPEEVLRMPSLAHLDMSETAIKSLPEDTRSGLEELRQKSGSFVLNLTGNTLMCSCYTLDFVQWIYETSVQLDSNRDYPCVQSDGTMSDTLSFYKDYLHQWRNCIGPALFTTSLVIGLVLILLIATTALLQRYLPQIEHAFLRFRGYHTAIPLRRTDFRYDAFICYDDSDYQWPCHCLYKELLKNRNIRLYLPDIHSIPGEAKADSIIEAISDSWKVVVVLSETSFTDEWFYFTIMSAVRLLSSRGTITSRIILLYKDDTPELRAKIPTLLIKVLGDNCVIGYSDTRRFWHEMCQLIVDVSGPDMYVSTD